MAKRRRIRISVRRRVDSHAPVKQQEKARYLCPYCGKSLDVAIIQVAHNPGDVGVAVFYCRPMNLRKKPHYSRQETFTLPPPTKEQRAQTQKDRRARKERRAYTRMKRVLKRGGASRERKSVRVVVRKKKRREP